MAFTHALYQKSNKWAQWTSKIFLIQQFVGKYRTKHFPGVLCFYYIHTETVIILAAFLFQIFPKWQNLPLHTAKYSTKLVKPAITKNVMMVFSECAIEN